MVIPMDGQVLLESSEQGLKHALDRFSGACYKVGMKLCSKKRMVLYLSRNARCGVLQVRCSTLQHVKFNSHVGVFTSEGRRKDIDTRDV